MGDADERQQYIAQSHIRGADCGQCAARDGAHNGTDARIQHIRGDVRMARDSSRESAAPHPKALTLQYAADISACSGRTVRSLHRNTAPRSVP